MTTVIVNPSVTTSNNSVERIIMRPNRRMWEGELKVYREWKEIILRELIQNSIDAHATRIDITWDEANYVLTITDNGKGMTEDILKNVYFSPGATTKEGDNDQNGGFGRARLVTCIAQRYYKIWTHDNYAEGECDQINFSKLLDDQFVNGCKLEIGILKKFEGYPVHINMVQEFINFVRYCNFKDVTITFNGEAFSNYLKVRKDQYVCDLEMDGEVFCKVYKISQSVKYNYPQTLVVRSEGGLLMFTKHIPNLPCCVILEITVASSKVLMTNRDGFGREWSNIVSEFISGLTVDPKSTLKKRTNIIHIHQNHKALSLSNSNFFSEKQQQEVISRLVDNLKYDEPYAIIRGRIRHNGIDVVDLSRKITPDTINSMVKSGKLTSTQHEELKRYYTKLKEHDDQVKEYDPSYTGRYESLYDYDDREPEEKILKFFPYLESMVINIDTVDFPNIGREIKTFWKPEILLNNTNSKRFKTIVWWYTICKEVLNMYLEYLATEKNQVIDISWGVGITLNDEFSSAEHWEYRGSHYLLINPLDRDGNLKFSIDYTKQSGKQSYAKMLRYAIHEIAHIFQTLHNEYYVQIEDEISELLHYESTKKTNRVIAAVSKCLDEVPKMSDVWKAIEQPSIFT